MTKKVFIDISILILTAHKAKVSSIITYNEKDFQKININKIPIVLPGNFRV